MNEIERFLFNLALTGLNIFLVSFKAVFYFLNDNCIVPSAIILNFATLTNTPQKATWFEPILLNSDSSNVSKLASLKSTSYLN